MTSLSRDALLIGVLAMGCSSPTIDDPFATATFTASATEGPPPTTSADDGNGSSGVPETDSASSSPMPETTGDGGPMTTPATFDGTAGSGSSDGGPPPSCGNGVQEGDEACDLSDLGGQTCADFGFEGGTLSCYVNCQGISTDGCFICGNGEIEGEEECEGTVPQGMACDDLGFTAGDLACGADCHFDTSGCSTCPNGVAEGIENCDGDDLGGATCTSIGFDGGTLACGATCAYDFSGCSGSNLTCAEQVIGNTYPQTVMGTTAGEDEDLAQSCGGGGVDYVMVFIAPVAGNYTFDAIGSSYDTVLSVHSDCDGTELGCNDDFVGNPTCGCCSCSEVTVNLMAGEQVLVAMSGFGGQTGAFVLNVDGP